MFRWQIVTDEYNRPAITYVIQADYYETDDHNTLHLIDKKNGRVAAFRNWLSIERVGQ